MTGKVTIKIGGMHCVSCAQNIESSLKSFNGVRSASVSFATATAVVEYDPSKVGLAERKEA